jgi:magnesium chelatase subunit D
VSELDGTPGIAELPVDAARVLERQSRADRHERGAIGRRDRSLVALRRGKHSRHRLAESHHRDVALDATLRAAARRAGRARGEVVIESEDLRRKVREHRVPLEVCFVVDNSYSLQADRMVEKVKGLAFGLLEDAVGKRDRVSLVAFRPGTPEATLALRPTSSLRIAAARLAEVPLSGRTPLAAALRVAGRTLRQERAKRPNARPVVVVVSDGISNVPLRAGGDPLADVLAEARALKRAGVRCVVVDAAQPGREAQSCGPALAEAAGGLHLPLADVSPAAFLDALGEVA